MSYQKYKDLTVYKKAYQLGLYVHVMCKSLPSDEKWALVDQMRRASRSICANIAEGLGKDGTKIEERRFLSIAMGSAEEMLLWLDFCRDFGYVTADKVAKTQEAYTEVAKMLHKMMSLRR